ncbi:hypothetical protein Tco_0558980 [Tanacetum coccineum]
MYVPYWDVTNDARLDDPVMCRNLVDHVSPPGCWASLHNRHDLNFLDLLNVTFAQHVCMVYELRLRYEHEILTREKFEQKFVQSSEVVQQKDVEIVALKAKVEKAENEAVEVSKLCRRVSELKAEAVTRSKKVVSKLEVDYQSLQAVIFDEARIRDEFASIQDAEARHFKERSAELDACIAELNHDMDTELYPHMLTDVVGQRWVIGHGFYLAVMKCAQSTKYHAALGKVILMAINKGIKQGLEARIEHGKAGRSLGEVEAYDSRVEAEYVVTVNEFENVSFPLLEELKALKDSLLTLLMSSLTLEVTVPVYFECGGSRDPNSINHEILLSDALAASHDRAEKRKIGVSSSSPTSRPSIALPAPDSSYVIVDYQISSLAIGGVAVPSSEPHDDLFDTTMLDKPVDS